MPALGRLLHQTRAVSDQALDQIVRHFQPRFAPQPGPPHKTRRQQNRESHPDNQQHGVRGPARAGRQHRRRQYELDERDQRLKAAAQSQKLDRLRLDHPSEKLAGSLMPGLVRLQPQRAKKQPSLQQTAGAQRQSALQPGRQHFERRQRQHQQHPAEQPAAIKPTLESGLPDHPPGEDPQRVFGRMRSRQREQPARETGHSKLALEAGARGRAQEPAGGLGGAQPFSEQGRADAGQASFGQARLGEEPIEVRSERLFPVAEDGRANRLRPHPPRDGSGVQQHAAGEHGEEPPAADLDQRRAGRAQAALEIGAGDPGELGLEVQARRRGNDPASQPPGAVVPGDLGRIGSFTGAAAQAAVFCQRPQRVAEARDRPEGERLSH